MIEFLTEYGMFFAKAGTLVLLFLLAFRSVFRLKAKAKSMDEEHLEVKKLNEKYANMNLALKSATLPKKAFKQALKELKSQHKQEQKSSLSNPQKRVFVLNFKGDIRASEVNSLRESITAILTTANSKDEILVILESAGGAVHGYGLAASQLQRIRDKGIHLTVSVDKVAASGGYMMACVADHIIAAPFAIIGSIGVVGQVPNFNRLLKNLNIDFEQMTAGEYKRTLSVFGENTDKGRRKAQQELEEVHQLFKDFVIENRPNMDIEKIATGEHWYGKRALQLNLIDEIRTSDDYLCTAAETADLFLINYCHPKRFMDRLYSHAASLFYNTLNRKFPGGE